MRSRTDRVRASFGLIALLAAVLTPVAWAEPAAAHHCSGGADIIDRGGEAAAECHTETPPDSGISKRTEQGTLWGTYCSNYGPYAPGQSQVSYSFAGELTPDEVARLGYDPTGTYAWYTVTCDGVDSGHVLVLTHDAPVPPRVLRDRVVARLQPLAPAPAASPPLDRPTYVNLPTWLWLDPAYWEPTEASETQGITTVTVRATPTEAHWVMGDGGDVTCDGPGTPWWPGAPEEATDCAYTYRHSSYGEPAERFQAQVTVTWSFEWWLNGTYQGAFGTVEVTAPFEVRVGEIQAIETRG